MKRLDPLTSIRFFAAILVVFVHAKETFAPYLPAFLNSFIGHGYVGVNLFFVLSGFILTYNYLGRFQSRTVSNRDFFVARFARLYPVFLFALLAAAPKAFQETLQPNAPSFGSLVASHLTLTHAWFPTHGNIWVGPAWSIGTEFFFYLAFPLLILPIARLERKGVWLALLGVYAASWVLPALYSMGVFDNWSFGPLQGELSANRTASRIIRWWPMFRLPEFLFGALFCRLYLAEHLRPTWLTVPRLGYLAAAGMVAILAMMASGGSIRFMFMNQVALTLPFALVLWYLAYEEGLVARLLSWKPLVILGEASYSLYMLHIGIFFVGDKVAERLLGVGKESPAVMAGIIAVAIAASIVSFYLIETPSRRWLVKRFSKPKPHPVPEPATPPDPLPEAATSPTRP